MRNRSLSSSANRTPLCSTLSRNRLQWLTRTMPDRMSHSITISTRATPNSMTSPSRAVNFDFLIAPLQQRKATKEDSTVGRTVLTDGG